jgi:hypothetical protein
MRLRFFRLHPNDGAGWAVLLAGSTLYAEIDKDVALGLAFLNGTARATHNTRSTQDAFVGD